MTSRNRHSANTSFYASITDAAKVEKIVDYIFERDDKSNVLAIHQRRPLIAYLINIERTPKGSESYGNNSIKSPASSSINGQINRNSAEKTKTVSIRIIDYVTRQRCLAKGVYHALPADCVFTINSLICSQADITKLAIVDRMANIYLYDISYFIESLTATRIAVIMGPGQEASPYETVSLVWCPFVPCEDFDDGDGGLRLALATNSKIELFAVDRLQGKAGNMERSDLKGAYKCLHDAHKSNVVTLSISPDCSTISTAALDNRVTFFSSDIDDSGQRCLHNWEASITDKSSISKLFFLDDYPKLLEDSSMKFWGAAFIGTRGGQMLLVDLRTWTVYQRAVLGSDYDGPKNFDYRIDLTSRNIVALSGNQCFIVQIEHDHTKSSSSTSSSAAGSHPYDTSIIDAINPDMTNGILNNLSKSASTPRSSKNHSNACNDEAGILAGLPRIFRTTKLGFVNPIHSFVIKHKSDHELEMFTISSYSLERYTINLNALNNETIEVIPMSASKADEPRSDANTPHELQRFLQQFDGSLRISSSGTASKNTLISNEATNTPNSSTAVSQMHINQREMDVFNLMNTSRGLQGANQMLPASPSTLVTKQSNVNSSIVSDSVPVTQKSPATSLDLVQMDRLVEALFTRLNTAFSQGLDEFLNDVKSEVNDLKLKLNGLCRDVRKLQQQLQETRQKS